MQFSKYRSALNLLLIVFLIFPFGSGCQAKVSEHISHQEKEGVLYHCPMHPSVISKKPGNCPICGMALVKNEEGTDASPIKVPGHANVVVFPERQQLIGLTSSLVETKPLTLTLHAAGHVAYNPDLSQALAEYVDASQAYWRSKRLGTDVARERGEKLLELAELKLRLAGFDDKQMGLIKIQPSARPPVITDQFIPVVRSRQALRIVSFRFNPLNEWRESRIRFYRRQGIALTSSHYGCLRPKRRTRKPAVAAPACRGTASRRCCASRVVDFHRAGFNTTLQSPARRLRLDQPRRAA